MPNLSLNNSYEARIKRKMKGLRWRLIHLDPLLLIGLIILAATGLFILYSASNENTHMVEAQSVRLVVSFVALFIFAQIPPRRYYQWAPWIFFTGLLLLLFVLFFGHAQLGAKRWIAFGFIRFQPSEIMKIALPLILAWYLSGKSLPLKWFDLMVCGVLLIIPTFLIAKEPDLGTAIIIAFSGFCVLFLAGLRWRFILTLLGLGVISMPFIWHFMHDYQKQRVLTFFNPERDPLGSGYHIIQSKIAVGSGGLFGKGYLNGTQSHLSFLPAHATDFIFAVSGEEFGLIGCVLIVLLFLFIFIRCMYMSLQAQDTFTRLFTGSFALTFIVSAFINIGMVIGILPVVGVPLPLISYGGSSMLTSMIVFGMMMSIHTHRKMWSE